MADKTIPDLTAAAAVALTDLFEIAQPASKKATITQLQSVIASGFVPTSRTIGTTAPLAGGGDLSADRVFSIADAAADGATKGAAAFLAADFTSAGGVIGVDYANGQKATAAQPGFLTAADWTTFNSKASNEAPFVDTTAIVKGSVDATKLLRFEVDGLTAGATRVLTPPDQNFTMAGWEVANIFTAKQRIVPPVNTVAFQVDGFSLTGANAQSLADLSGTWNTSGVPSAIKLNITNTASGAGSLLMDLQVGAASKFSVNKDGAVVAASSFTGSGLIIGASALIVSSSGTSTWTFNAGANVPQIAASGISAGTLKISNVVDPTLAQDAATKAYVDSVAGTAPFVDTTAIVKGSADATKLLRIEVDGFTTGTTRVATPPNQNFTIAGLEVENIFTVKQRIAPPVNTEALTVTGFSLTGANAQSMIDFAGTWNTSNAPTAFNLDITNTASDATSLLMALKKDGTAVFSVGISGDVSCSGVLSSGNGQFSVQPDGSFLAAGGPFAVDASSNLTINNNITFNNSAITVMDDGSKLVISSDLQINSVLSFAVSGITITDDGTRAVFSSGIQIGTATLDDDGGGGLTSGTFLATVQLVVGGVALTDVGGDRLALATGYSLKFGISAVSAVGIIADSYILVTDGAGNDYKLLCVAA